MDPILGMSVLYKKDTDPKKVDLGVGAFRTEEGKPYIFDVIREAEKHLLNDLNSGKINKEYQGSEGNHEYLELSKKVIFGDSLFSSLKSKVASTQSVGGTGALRIAADFIRKFPFSNTAPTIYLPKPTWGNHHAIFKQAGFKVEEYPYWKKETRGLDLEGMIKKFKDIPSKSIVLLHACAHNPTGVDPSDKEWETICNVMKEKNHFTFFDNAYQGFASGNLEKDAFAIRHFANQGLQMIVTQSYSKTLGLYGERAGAFHLLCSNEKTAENCLTQLRIVVRTNYSNPPLHPMRLVLTVLKDKNLYSGWLNELEAVAGRIIEMRKLLREELERIKTPGNWDNITNQIGMFSYTGMTEKQCERMINNCHIYMLKNGRISMSGVTKKNVKYIAQSIKKSVEADN